MRKLVLIPTLIVILGIMINSCTITTYNSRAQVTGSSIGSPLLTPEDKAISIGEFYNGKDITKLANDYRGLMARKTINSEWKPYILSSKIKEVRLLYREKFYIYFDVSWKNKLRYTYVEELFFSHPLDENKWRDDSMLDIPLNPE